MYGYTGKILVVNLTEKKISTINTRDYEEWIGGHGIATAIFFDRVKDKTISAFDPDNVLVMVSGLFAGTLVPGACRMEMVGIQAQSYPYEWFGSSNAGGRFPAMLKFAGYDGIVLEGKADKPTWINIIDGDVKLEDASRLWGLDTWETQNVIFKEISQQVNSTNGFGDWRNTKGELKTTQWPAILAIGPAGENKSRIAIIQHDASCAFGQGGFGGVWGAKNLKAISALGTGHVKVADPKALMEARLWAGQKYGADPDNPKINAWQEFITSHFGGHPGRGWTPFDKQRRSHGCYGCHLNCRPRISSGLGNEGICTEALFYQAFDLEKHGQITEISGKATGLLDKMGINAFELYIYLPYLKTLHDKGILGRGKKIETDLPFDKIGEVEFAADLIHKIAYRKGIGDDLAEGFPRAAERWGRIDEDYSTGILQSMSWGYPMHYDPRTEVYWGYASLISGRDVNSHDFNVISYWMPTLDIAAKREPIISAMKASEIIAEKCIPYNDPQMIDFSDQNLYSIHMAKTTAWLLHYCTFWKRSCGLCDNAFADFVNPYGPDNKGLTPEGEMRFFKAVTGKDLSFADTMEIGRKIFTLNRGIWTLQGRHRDMEKFPEFIYSVPAEGTSYVPGEPPSYYMPVLENEKWIYKSVVPRCLDREKVEEWKTIFYKLEGWNPKMGWPSESTLNELGLQRLSAELKKAGKLK